MEYYEYDGRLCVSMDMLIRDERTEQDQSVSLAPILVRGNYDTLVRRGKIKVLRSGKGKGNCALIEVASLPEHILARVVARYGDPRSEALYHLWDSHYELNVEARAFYDSFRFGDGSPLPREHASEYTINASVLDAVLRLKSDTLAVRKLMGNSRLSWAELGDAINYYQRMHKHTLPLSPTRFASRAKQYLQADGRNYESLISGKFGNQQTRKVSHPLERILLSIAGKPTKPSDKEVWETYHEWIAGRTQLVDYSTGEMMVAQEFLASNPKALELSQATVSAYLKKPKNVVLLSYLHDTSHDFNQEQRPHHHRHAPEFSFSKISLDDRDLPRPMENGRRVKAYYAVDVASGAIIGYAHSRLKTRDLFLDCLRNMFQLIIERGWRVPGQVEVEHHLVREFADGLIKAGEIFPFVRWCNPGNSQEKRAEHVNRRKKYGVEKRKHQNIGRWYSRLASNRTKHQKVFDAENDNYTEKRYSYEQLVAEDIADIMDYNMMLHSNQKKYPGMTLWDVLCSNINPTLPQLDKAKLATYIGEHRETTIRRNMYMQICGEMYQLPSPELIAQLASRNTKVDAYWIPMPGESVPAEIYCYQGGRYFATCQRVSTYNEATIEQTEADHLAYERQAAYVAEFDGMMRRERIGRMEVITSREQEHTASIVADAMQEEHIPEMADELLRDSDDEYNEWLNPELMRERARANL